MTRSSEIYDPLRRKWVPRTPEEVVRQDVIAWLRDVKGFSTSLMESEYDFLYNRRHYRADILVFNRQLQPHLLVECKANGVKIDRTVIDQVVRYTRVLAVKYVLVTNGVSTYLQHRNAKGTGYDFLPEIPEDLS